MWATIIVNKRYIFIENIPAIVNFASDKICPGCGERFYVYWMRCFEDVKTIDRVSSIEFRKDYEHSHISACLIVMLKSLLN